MKRRIAAAALVVLSGALGWPLAARAQSRISEASALSMLPVALSIEATGLLLSAGAQLSVAVVTTAADGAVWVLERASDGARMSLRVSGQVAGGVSVAAGTAILVTALSTGWLLSAAGQAVAFVPNEIGRALMHNERISR